MIPNQKANLAFQMHFSRFLWTLACQTFEEHNECLWEFKKAKVITLVIKTELGWLGYIDKHPVILTELMHGAKVTSGCPRFLASSLAEAFLMIGHEC